MANLNKMMVSPSPSPSPVAKKRPSPLGVGALLKQPLLGKSPKMPTFSSPNANHNPLAPLLFEASLATSPGSGSGPGLGGSAAIAGDNIAEENSTLEDTTRNNDFQLGSLKFKREVQPARARHKPQRGVVLSKELPSDSVMSSWHDEDTELTNTDPPPPSHSAFNGALKLFYDVILPVPIVATLLMLCSVFALAIRESKEITTDPTPVEIRGKALYVNGTQYVVKGVAYHPIWGGVDARYEYPFGDVMYTNSVQKTLYVTSYREYNKFHLKRIAMTFNTIRLYNWLLEKQHDEFLDDCHDLGLKVIVTFWMDSHNYPDLEDDMVLKRLKVNFAHLIRKYRSHPAVLMWSVSNEPNLEDNPYAFFGQLPAFFQAVKLLSEVRDAEENIKNGFIPHPMMVPMANNAEVRDQMERYDGSTGFEVWGLQPYVGPDRLNDMLLQFNLEKPILLSEYGADSFVDFDIGQSAFRHSGQRYPLYERNQTESLLDLTRVIAKYLVGKENISLCVDEVCPHDSITYDGLPDPRFVKVGDYKIYNQGVRDPLTHLVGTAFVEEGDDATTVDDVVWSWENGSLTNPVYEKLIGGAVFEWMDEWWKGSLWDSDHPNCDVDEPDVQSTCGAQVRGFGLDQRINEEWLGVSAQNVTGSTLCLEPKPVLQQLSALFAVSNESYIDCATEDCCVTLPAQFLMQDYSMHLHLLVFTGILVLLLIAMAVIRYLRLQSKKHEKEIVYPELVPPTWAAKAPGSGPSTHSDRHRKGGTATLRARSTPLEDVDTFLPFPQVRTFLETRTDVHKALSDMSWGLTNPVLWNGSSWVPRGSVRSMAAEKKSKPWKGSSEFCTSKHPLSLNDVVGVRCIYENGEETWATGTLDEKPNAKGICTVKLANPLIIATEARYLYKLSKPPPFMSKELVRIKVNGHQQEALVVNTDYKVSVSKVTTNMDTLRSAFRVSFPSSNRDVKLTKNFALSVASNHKAQKPTGTDLKTRPRYDMTLAYEAYVHAVGQAVLRRCFKYHSEQKAHETKDLLSLEGDDFFGDVPDHVMMGAIRDAHNTILPMECIKASNDENEGVLAEGKWCGSFDLATKALLFLVLQQRVDSLRQAKWLKIEMYLHVLKASDNSYERKKNVLSALRDVVNMCQHHLELVKARAVNYADLDEIYEEAEAARVEQRSWWPLVQDGRAKGVRMPFEQILKKVRGGDTLRKTFPERLSWAVPLRLFTFTLHFHILLYYTTIAVQMKFNWDLTLWLLAMTEACLCIANRLIDIWMFPLPHHAYHPSVLSILELLASAGLVAKKYKPAGASDMNGFPVNMLLIYLAFMFVSQLVIRPLAKMLSTKGPVRVLKWRGLTLVTMLLIQVALAWFVIAPSVATLSLNVCKCPEINVWLSSVFYDAPRHCKASGNDVICVTSLVLIFFVSFISLNLLAHVNYMFLSIICGYIVGFIKKLGTVKEWTGAQVVFSSFVAVGSEPSPLEHDAKSGQVVPDFGIYGNFMPEFLQPGITVQIEKCVGTTEGELNLEIYPEGQEDIVRNASVYPGEVAKFYCVKHFPEEARNASALKFDLEGYGVVRVGVPRGEARVHSRLSFRGVFLDVAVRRVNGKKYTGPTAGQFAMHGQLMMLKNVFRHMWERDLISRAHYEKYTRWDFELLPPEEALIHFLQFLNGAAGLKAMFPSTSPDYIFNLLQKKVSVFGMKSITFFVPYYSETVLFTMKELIGKNVLEHMVDLWSDEWAAFVERNFYGLRDTERVLTAAKQGEVHVLWAQMREEYESGCKVGRRQWGEFMWRYDAPPMSLFEDVRLDARTLTKADEEAYMRKARYWIELQIRIWCSMRGQTLMRNVYGLCDMREAIVDLAYYELKAVQGSKWVASEAHPSERSTITEVLAWVKLNSNIPKQWKDTVNGSFTKVDNVSYVEYVCHAVLYHRVNGARLFGEDKTWSHSNSDWYKLLSSKNLQESFSAWNDDHGRVSKSVVADLCKDDVLEALASQMESAVSISAEANALHEKAEVLVSTKIQLCFGAQVYFDNVTVRSATNELLRMDRTRHLELATDSSKNKNKKSKAAFTSTHVSRKSAPINRTNFLDQFGEPVNTTKLCSNCGHYMTTPVCTSTGEQHDVEILDKWRPAEEEHFMMTTFDRQSLLVLGEGKAENQNNMITCARGEILNILDMNQDGYYAEGIKLPFITNLWSDFNAGNVREGFIEQRDDTYQVMGFREHIFTQSHSAVGRYMALAEFSFVTLIQRFLASPHEVRMHYGHPDMVNAHLMKQTGGVSRASLSVNVNEDIFLGYEMAQNGRRICMIENMSFGKGREVDFNNASTFLKKLSAGCVMQLSSREVHNLYTRVLSLPSKWALFYGSIAHFVNIFLMDLSIFAFTYALMFFSLADITPQVLRLNQSPFADPWLFQIGMFYIVPMLVEMNLEHSYLKLSDFVMSIPFFSHQNRITASFFSYTMQISSAKYLGTDRGMGHQPRKYVEFLVNHTWTNFVPAFKLIACIVVFWWGTNGCDQCHSEGSIVRLWIVMVSAFSYLSGPALYNPKPSFTSIWHEARSMLSWMNTVVPSRFCVNSVSVDAAAFQDFAKKGGSMSSIAVFWIFEWLEYLNSKALDAGGSFVSALGVLAKEVVVMTVKYVPWAAVVYFALGVSRGVGAIEVIHDIETGNVTTVAEDIPMHTVRPSIVYLVLLDVFLWEVGNAAKYLFPSEGAYSTAPRLIRLVVLPLILFIAVITAFAYGGTGLWETLRDVVGYMFFSGVAFSLLTDMYLAMMQFCISLRRKRQGAYHLVQTLYDSENWEELSGQNLRTCKECQKGEIPLEETKCPHCTRPLSPLAYDDGAMLPCSITDVYDMADKAGKPEVRYSVDCNPQVALMKRRLWHLIMVSRWSPLLMYFRRMYYLVLLFLAFPSGIAAALSSIHTTWLFNDKVARRSR